MTDGGSEAPCVDLTGSYDGTDVYFWDGADLLECSMHTVWDNFRVLDWSLWRDV